MKNKYERDQQEPNSTLIIKKVDKNSIAEELELEAGDKILSINNQNLLDELDYLYLTALNEFELTIEKSNGEIWDITIEKDDDENLGIHLKDTLKTKECSNHCLFCFIDQMPKGMRDSLYVKDDDERLSFLNGNYVTLTNLSKQDLERICKWKIPINISIHTTDPELRRKILGNKRADQILSQLQTFYDNQVEMNGQIVLVPDLNDQSLEKTILDCINFYPYLKSLSVVPVGKTKYRDKLFKLRTFTKEEAKQIIFSIENLQSKFIKEFNTPFVFLSDEFYLLAEKEIPNADHYGNFNQLENGVGMVRDFLTEFKEYLSHLKFDYSKRKNILTITGKLFEPILKQAIIEFNQKFPNIKVKVLGVSNNYFGKDITVTGLLTGQDIINTILKENIEKYDEVYLPEAVLKAGTDILLDNITIRDIEEKIKKPVKVLQDNGTSLIKNLME